VFGNSLSTARILQINRILTQSQIAFTQHLLTSSKVLKTNSFKDFILNYLPLIETTKPH